jgi:hypothetical protein
VSTHLCHPSHSLRPRRSRNDGQSSESTGQLYENRAHTAGGPADPQGRIALAFTNAKSIEQ